MAHSGMAHAVPEDGAVMKRLILSLLLITSLGAFSQGSPLLAQTDRKTSFPHGELASHSSVEHHSPTNITSDTQRLLDRADRAYSKMGYARAARIYDRVLARPDAFRSASLLAKAGDAHYYSGDLQSAHALYQERSRRYGESLDQDPERGLVDMARWQRAAQVHALFDEQGKNPIENDSLFPGEGVPLVKIRNLELNSKYSDFAPMFHRGTQLVFASSRDTGFLRNRRYKKNKQPFLDLYVVDVQGGEDVPPIARKFSQVLNTKYHEASVAFSKDERTIYFTRNNFGKRLKRKKNRDVAHLKIFRSTLVAGEWTPAEELPINGERFSTGHPTLSPDGKQLYFVSDRPGGFGGTDLYVVDLLPSGGFSEPKNLGRTVNTDAKEMFPYITENALYFSSDRAMGLGGLDVYRAGHSGGMFSVAVNLGGPINSDRDDFSFIVDASGERGYFASNRKGGKGDDDIYAFDRIMNLNSISGVVAEAGTQQPLQQAKVVLLDKAENLLDQTLTRADGGYVFKDLSPTTPYTLKVSKEGFRQTKVETATQGNRPVKVDPVMKKELELVDEAKKRIVLDPLAIRFDFDRYNIRPKAAQELDKLVALLKGNPSLLIKIEAHTDAIGDSGYNLYLSDKRAKATRDYLVSRGVDTSQIESAMGYGEERPLNECSEGTRCTKEQHRVNRRSEFHIVSQ